MHRKILIADDNVINRHLLINTLCNDYDIIEAKDGQEAITLIHKNYKMLSAVLLDIVMPKMTGYEVLGCMKENVMLSQIPVIMVTGSEDEASRIKALSLGANDFILKPFNPDIVKHCLRNNIALRETASILNAIQKDKLTGLYNREAFFERAGMMIKAHEPGYYIMSSFDVDNFKIVNEQFGAVEGDRLLKEIGNVIKNNVEGMDGLAGRISADNFAAIFPADKIDTGILAITQENKIVSFDQWPITFSVGRYIVSDITISTTAIYDRAYLAKQSVKGRYDKHLVYFDESMLQKMVRDQQITINMETALAERQFEIWFQPQYNHVLGTLIGAEALVRWRHPQKGIIPPGNFIPLFESNGFIYELDKYVWREACRYLRKWMDEGHAPLPVSVNVSRYDIFHADLIDVILACLNDYNIPVELLRLEITESAFAKSTNTIVKIVKKFVDLGFTIEIDDFGSGYSSLNTLKSVPAQIVKLDMRFLQEDDQSQRGGNILESIVRMTKWLGMSVIAEGVETKEQGDFLKSIGCSQVQGYLYARPMPANEYEAHFENARKDDGITIFESADHLNNDMFWNPNSIDSLIFNSYVGAACIYEYYNGKLELLRATDKYATMLGGKNMTVDELMKLDFMKYLDKDISTVTLSKIDSAIRNKEEIYGEFLFIDLPGCSHETYIKSTVRVISNTDNRYLLYCINENITAQRVSEKNERKATMQLQAVLKYVNCGITATVVNGDDIEFLFVNDKYYEILGYTKEQYNDEIRHSIYNVVCEEDKNYFTECVGNAIATKIPVSIEYRVVKRDKSIAWIRSYFSVTNIEGIDVPVHLCTFADVTIEKHTTQDLLDNLPCGAGICVVTENDAKMVYLNKRYFSYFTHNEGTRRTKSVFSVIHPDDRATLQISMQPALKKGGEGSCVVRILDAANKYISFRLSGRAVETHDTMKKIYVTFVPISHEELSFSEMLPVVLEKVMEASSDFSYIKDKNLRYICCSSAFAQMVGLNSSKDVIGKTDYDLFNEKLALKYTESDKELINNGIPIIDFIEEIPFKYDKTRYSRMSKFLLCDSANNAIGLYGIGYDITDEREVESRQKFLINNIPGGVAIFEGRKNDIDSKKLIYYSDGFCSLFGYTRKEYESLTKKELKDFVVEEDIAKLSSKIKDLVENNQSIDHLFRAKTKDGTYRWLHVKAVMSENNNDKILVNTLFFDVTDEQEVLEKLRVSEEENRLAVQHSNSVVCRYDIAAKTVTMLSFKNPLFNIESIVYDVPYKEISDGKISEGTADIYKEFYENIMKGCETGSAVYQRKSLKGWRWLEAHFSTIFAVDGKPISAVISVKDVTEDLEKTIVYKKWLQSLNKKNSDAYSLLRYNISKKTVIDTKEGSLLSLKLRFKSLDFDAYMSEYVQNYVCDDDKDIFYAAINGEALLKKYNENERIFSMEYREKISENKYRWLCLTIDLVSSSQNNDIEAYLLFEDIDKEKREALITIAHAENDPLTNVLNRIAFSEKVNRIIKAAKPNDLFALIMLDIDGFKMINDVFGHSVGDKALVDIADILKNAFCNNNLVGRMGGDEFVVFLNNIPDERFAAIKAKQICDLIRKSFSLEVQISGSAGIALCPHDGNDFETLYKKADSGLYFVKGSGKDNFAFYRDDMKDEHLDVETDGNGKLFTTYANKRRMLIVEDNSLDYEVIANMFRNDFIIEKAKDGASALVRLRHYGSAISVVLLDLMMPGLDGFAVLEKMQQSYETKSIPVIVVSGLDNRETGLKAIKYGASDFVVKPVDTEILRIRVKSAVTKAENDKLRIKNNLLEMQNAETKRYRMVLDKIGLAIAEWDVESGIFFYGPAVQSFLYGIYDDRPIWDIWQMDGVANEETVINLKNTMYDVSKKDDEAKSSMTILLKTPIGEKHHFDVNIYRTPKENDRMNKIILTFCDLDVKIKI